MKKRHLLFLTALVLTLALAWLYYQPYRTLQLIRKAALNGDAEAIKDYVDFPSLRESFKENLSSFLTDQIAKESQDNPFAGLAGMFAGTILNASVDTLITPQNLITMLKNNDVAPEVQAENNSTKDVENNAVEHRRGYDSFSRFSERVIDKASQKEILALIFRRYGLSWKLTAVRLPFDSLPLLPESPSTAPAEEPVQIATASSVPPGPPAIPPPPNFPPALLISGMDGNVTVAIPVYWRPERKAYIGEDAIISNLFYLNYLDTGNFVVEIWTEFEDEQLRQKVIDRLRAMINNGTVSPLGECYPELLQYVTNYAFFDMQNKKVTVSGWEKYFDRDGENIAVRELKPEVHDLGSGSPFFTEIASNITTILESARKDPKIAGRIEQLQQ